MGNINIAVNNTANFAIRKIGNNDALLSIQNNNCEKTAASVIVYCFEPMAVIVDRDSHCLHRCICSEVDHQ